MEGVFDSEVRYVELDRSAADVRVRLRSMAVRIEHGEGREHVRVVYAQPDGTLRRVDARHAIMSGWGAVAKHIVPELSETQRRALEEYRYCSALYINVMLRSWEPIAELGAFETFRARAARGLKLSRLLRLRVGGRLLFQEVALGGGFGSTSCLMLELGLGEARRIDEMEIRWLGGNRRILRDIDANQRIEVVEGKPGFRPLP